MRISATIDAQCHSYRLIFCEEIAIDLSDLHTEISHNEELRPLQELFPDSYWSCLTSVGLTKISSWKILMHRERMPNYLRQLMERNPTLMRITIELLILNGWHSYRLMFCDCIAFEVPKIGQQIRIVLRKTMKPAHMISYDL